MKHLWLLLISASIFTTSVLCAKKKEARKLSTGQEVKNLQVDNKLTVKCSWFHEDGEALDIKWYKDEAPIESNDHIVISSTEEKVSDEKAVDNKTESTMSKMVIEKPLEEDIGFYDCRTTKPPALSKSFIVTSITYQNLPKSTEINEEEDLSLSCIAHGDPNLKPSVYWEKENVLIEDAVNASKLNVYTNADGLPLASFNITSVDQSDRGHYTCVITFEENLVYRTTTNVRVKDPLRALWPFLGIVLQALLLAFTIFMCEKMKTKEGDDDSDDDSNIAAPSAVASTSAVST